MDQISYESSIFAYFIYQNWENYMQIFWEPFWSAKILGDLNILIRNIEEISREDKKIPEAFEKGTNHDDVPLHFKDIDVILPNNRNQAVRRINQVKQRF